MKFLTILLQQSLVKKSNCPLQKGTCWAVLPATKVETRLVGDSWRLLCALRTTPLQFCSGAFLANAPEQEQENLVALLRSIQACAGFALLYNVTITDYCFKKLHAN